METKQITKPITGVDGLVYSFYGRYPTKESARSVCLKLREKHIYKHLYYTKIMDNGETCYDVRTSNKKYTIMKVLDFTGCCQEQINNVTEYLIDNNIECNSTDDDTQNLIVSDHDSEKIQNEPKFENYDFHIMGIRYDVC